MKLIRGQTLGDLLTERPGPTHDRGPLLAAFEKVCEAVACAHAHGVLHRNLKPSNVMVGAFGEVQVMDWGLAKVLTATGSDGPGDPSQDDFDHPEGRNLTRPGQVMRTPAYMPPEQAREMPRRSAAPRTSLPSAGFYAPS